jgi:hypothetical protein
VDACKKTMEDLASLNERIGDLLQTEQVKMVRTGDLLTGRVDSPIALYMDSLYDLWGSDTVHGDKLAYSKIAIGLLDSLNRTLPDSDLRHNLQSKGSVPSIPPLTCCPGARTVLQGVLASARAATAAAAVKAEVPTAPTGSRTVTTPTSPTGTILTAVTNPTGITQHSPTTLVPAVNPAASLGAAAAAASTTRRPRAAGRTGLSNTHL